MFSFHKSDVSRSRQSSVDSQATGPQGSTFGQDIWPDQQPMSSSHAGGHSPELQHRFNPARRSSVFNLRSRSNTATSMTPSLLSLNQPDMADHETSWHGSPPGNHQGSGKSHQSTGSRRSLFRGKKGKRLSETPIIGVDEHEGDVSDRRTSILRKSRRGTNQSEDSSASLISRISSPFDFQHLSHTDRHQFAALEQAATDKLGPGYLTGRASQHYQQTPTSAASFHFNNFSSENLASGEERSSSALSIGSPPRSPDPCFATDSAPQFPLSRRPLRLARSIESFSQPGVSPRKHTQAPSITTPPLISPRLPLDPAYDDKMSNARRLSRSKRESGIWDSFALSAVTTPDPLPEIEEDTSYFGHALTTPDDSAIHATTPPFSPSLADVAEEPERFFSPRPAPQPPFRASGSPNLSYFGSFSFQNQQTPLGNRTQSQGQFDVSPRAEATSSRPSSQQSDTLGSTSVARRMSIRRPHNRRQSNTWRAIEESWEEDVDYIYDNALEAECDFEWDRASDSGADYTQIPAIAYAHNNRESQVIPTNTGCFESDSFRSSLLVPSKSIVPELDPTSTISISTLSTGLPTTPSDLFNSNHYSGGTGFVLSPSLLVPQEYKDTREVTYEDLLDEYAESDRHFPMLDNGPSATSSARSSHVRLSRRSSYDSSLMSSVQGSGLWSSPVRRSASSAGSVPDLVPSRRNRKELGFSLIVDQMADQIESLREDNDVTPPGRSLEGRTFFASDDETTQDEGRSSILIESEVKASLDLARRGSQRANKLTAEEELETSLNLVRQDLQRSEPAPTRQHKPTFSDGAAKLLSPSHVVKEQPAKPRSRAATTVQPRSPILSLFPQPPRATQTPVRM
ncbi:pak-box p21-rho-binding protein [Stemphylium lycopersici]|nr:pak-box p21-rho-binding protein [Stemphylium lycopersici]